MIKNILKVVFSAIDNKFETSLYQQSIKFQEAWYNSNFLNAIRRYINPSIFKLKYKLGLTNNPLKLHLGCGERHLESYINIDWRKTSATDLTCDIRKLPYPDNSIELIETYHVIEHLPRHNLQITLEEWHRVLIPGGKLIIEFPDFDEIVKRYLEGDERQLDGIFGLQRFEGDYHLFGYNIKKLSKILEESGFTNIEEKPPRDYHTKEWPCLRVKCMKDNNSDFFSIPH